MKTYCQPVFVAPFGNVTSISVVGFHVEVAFAHIPPSEDVVDDFKSSTFSKYSSKSSTTSFTTGDPTTQYDNYENFSHYTYHNVC